MTDRIKKLAAEVRNHVPNQRVSKSNRMLSLTEPQYSRFQEYCRSKGITASTVVDRLIGEFMAEVLNDKPNGLEVELPKDKSA